MRLSAIYRKRRFNWLELWMILDEKTPVRLTLCESIPPVKINRGRPCLTWLIENDLSCAEMKLELNTATAD